MFCQMFQVYKMRFLILILFTTLLSRSIGRPSRMEENSNDGEAEEPDYEGNEEDGNEGLAEEDSDAHLYEQDESVERLTHDAAYEQVTHADREKMQHSQDDDEPTGKIGSFPEYVHKRNPNQVDEEATSNSDYSYQEPMQSSKIADESAKSDKDLSQSEHVSTNNQNSNRLQSEPRNNNMDELNVEKRLSDMDDSNFENYNNVKNAAGKSKYYNNVLHTKETSHNLNHYYNTIQSNHENLVVDNRNGIAKLDVDRERRQAATSDTLNLSKKSEKDTFSDTANEDEEAAIKRQLKKLTNNELNELLKSLSDDKKALLNKIMEDDHNFVDKREINKSELGKIQGCESPIDTSGETLYTSDSTVPKKETSTETEETTSESTKMDSKNSNTELTKEADASSNNLKSEYQFDSASNKQLSGSISTEKTENKREINNNNKNSQGASGDTRPLDNNENIHKYSYNSLDEQSCFKSSQEEDSSQFLYDEAGSANSKREALLGKQEDTQDSMGSLEESFPSMNCEATDQYFESNMVPLVRVKRKNENKMITKRASGVLPDAKVGYFPYENDDDDDEGSEFDDDGFYDRSANYAKNNENDDTANQLSDSKDNLETGKENYDTMSLGSDTDGVLSGIEGVNDNLMYSSGNRNKRAQSQGKASDALAEETTKTESFANVHNQENDAFGALPRNYEGELGRYKRIRQVKSSSLPETLANK